MIRSAVLRLGLAALLFASTVPRPTAGAEPLRSPPVGRTGWVAESPGRPAFERQTKGVTAFDERQERAKKAVRQLNRCLDAYLDRGLGYPRSLVALGPAGLVCAAAELVADGDPALSVQYFPGRRDERGQIATYRLAVRARYPPHGNTLVLTPFWSDETSLLFHRDDRDRTLGLADPLPKLEWLDRQLRDFRRAHPDRGYPARLAELPADSHPNVREAQLSVLAGRLDGYRYLYTPAPADRQGRILSYRLDARPVRYRAETKPSYLCDPRGELRITPDDRAAEPTDRNLEEGAPHDCLGDRPLRPPG
ncbi:MAG TPA: hypothetical protein VGE98_15770 [Thermoanaerobaculia bacterium]